MKNVGFNEMTTHLDATFSKYQFGFRKRFSFQQCLIMPIEKIDFFMALLTDFSEAFDCLFNDLLNYILMGLV